MKTKYSEIGRTALLTFLLGVTLLLCAFISYPKYQRPSTTIPDALMQNSPASKNPNMIVSNIIMVWSNGWCTITDEQFEMIKNGRLTAEGIKNDNDIIVALKETERE